MPNKIHPCDLDPFGECPKRFPDCSQCVGWDSPPDPDEIGEENRSWKTFNY